MSAPEVERAARRGVPTRVLVVLVVLMLAAAAAVVLLGRDQPASAVEGTEPVLDGNGRTYRPGTLPEDMDAPLQVAVKVMPLALGYDYRSLDKNLGRATALMTDDFGAEFRRTFQRSAAQLARSKHAVTSATVRAAGVVKADEDRAVCLVYVDQALVSSTTLQNSDAPVRVSQGRVRLELTRVDGAWLVDDIEPF